MEQSNSKTAKRPGFYGYRCKYCGKYFQKLNELGNHVRFEHWRKWRRDEIPQLKPPKGGYLHLDKISKVRRIMRGRYVSIAYFIPKDWEAVKIWKLGEDEYGIILRFEPLKAMSEVKAKSEVRKQPVKPKAEELVYEEDGHLRPIGSEVIPPELTDSEYLVKKAKEVERRFKNKR